MGKSEKQYFVLCKIYFIIRLRIAYTVEHYTLGALRVSTRERNENGCG